MAVEQTGENNSYWGGGKTKRTCRECKKEFESYTSKSDTYCSRACTMAGLRFSYPQTKIAEELKQLGLNIEEEKRWDWLRSPETNRPLSIDIYIPKLNCAIEYDGKQHFKKTLGMTEKQFMRLQVNDRHKDTVLPQHGIRLIRVRGKVSKEVLTGLYRDIYEHTNTN